MDKFQISILEYLGKLDQGVLVLLCIVYDQKYYEATYFYTSEKLVLTVQEELEQDLQHKITEDKDYPNLVKNIISKVVPYNEIYSRLDPVNLTRWFNINEKTEE